MIVKQYIKDFEKLGFGMFVHYGLYSLLESGEWVKEIHHIPDEEYEALVEKFNPAPDWAQRLVSTAREAGCRYITLTTRHHDGFSLFDTCGLSEYDALHAPCKRDLIREFVDECHRQNMVPMLYHTLLDWHHPDFNRDFPAYLRYLRASVELLCKNYGKIGGLWFDGMWSKPDADWEEDALYGTIRALQPDAMIINNTGLESRGKLGHIELDSVTFERGKPQPINLENSPKYIASEMCEVMGDHWGYAREDLNYKSPARLIGELADCRRYRSNFLLDVGPMPEGYLRPLDAAMLELVGRWVAYNDEALHVPYPTDITVEEKPDDFVLADGNTYYYFCTGLPMMADVNVALVSDAKFSARFALPKKLCRATWLDNAEEVCFEQQGENVTLQTPPFSYGRSLVVRVAKLECEE